MNIQCSLKLGDTIYHFNPEKYLVLFFIERSVKNNPMLKMHTDRQGRPGLKTIGAIAPN